MRRLWIVLCVCACGRAEIYPHPTRPTLIADAGPQVRDGSTPDAGTPDPGPQTDAGCLPTAPACAFTSPPQSFSCIPGLRVVGSGVDGFGNFRYQLAFRQPLDHDNPNGPAFEQRLSLRHVSSASPMVLLATGYELYDTRDELTELFVANELSVEHRYFGSSATDGGLSDYAHLDIRQAANDLHRIRAAFASLYPKAWVSTGASKGGMTMVYYRRFFPCDVAGTVAYVAPHSGHEADPRYNTFLSQVGGAARADCRTRLENLTRQLLQKRDMLTAGLSDAGYGILGGLDVAFEVSVLDFEFGFWQYLNPDDPNVGCKSLPTGTISDVELRAWAFNISGNDDESIRPYSAYYFQAATQLGDPGSYDQPFAGLVRYPGKDSARAFLDKSIAVPPFDPAPMADIQNWLATEGTSIVFVYGELDPWSAGQFDIGQALDALKAIAPGNNHHADIRDLSLSERMAAIAKLERWLGVKVIPGAMLRAPVRVREPEHLRLPRLR